MYIQLLAIVGGRGPEQLIGALDLETTRRLRNLFIERYRPTRGTPSTRPIGSGLVTQSRLAAAAVDDHSYEDNHEDGDRDTSLDMPILPASLAMDILGLGPVLLPASSPESSSVRSIGPSHGLIAPPGLPSKSDSGFPPGFSAGDVIQQASVPSTHSNPSSAMESLAQFLSQYYSTGAAFRFDKLNDFYVLYPEYRGKVNKRLVEQEGRAHCIEWVNPPPSSSSGAVRWIGNTRCAL